VAGLKKYKECVKFGVRSAGVWAGPCLFGGFCGLCPQALQGSRLFACFACLFLQVAQIVTFLGETCHLCTPQFQAHACLCHSAPARPSYLLCGRGKNLVNGNFTRGVYHKLCLVSVYTCMIFFACAGPIARRWPVSLGDFAGRAHRHSRVRVVGPRFLGLAMGFFAGSSNCRFLGETMSFVHPSVPSSCMFVLFRPC
jgi:hypothetical protein